MAGPVTEFLCMPLKPGADLSDSGSDIGKVYHDLMNTVMSQPGARKSHWGIVDEDKSLAILFVDWDSFDHHKQFMDAM